MGVTANIVAPERPTKQPAESRTYAMDFAKFPELADEAETLSSVVSIAWVNGDGNEPTIGVGAISGTKVRFRLSGGTLPAGTVEKAYRVRVRVLTSGVNTLEADGYLILVD